jgi:hypothetical protein
MELTDRLAVTILNLINKNGVLNRTTVCQPVYGPVIEVLRQQYEYNVIVAKSINTVYGILLH